MFYDSHAASILVRAILCTIDSGFPGPGLQSIGLNPLSPIHSLSNRLSSYTLGPVISSGIRTLL